MTWHPNPDHPILTRTPPPAGWGSTITNSHDALNLAGVLKTMYVAIHEAGHATFFLRAGVPVDYIAIYSESDARPRDGVSGTTYVATNYARLSYEEIAAINAAGERAQDRWLRQEGLWAPGRAWSTERDAEDDRMRLSAVVADRFGIALTFGVEPTCVTDYAWVCDHTDRALSQRWSAVLALAHELVQAKRLTGARAQAIIDRTPSPRNR